MAVADHAVDFMIGRRGNPNPSPGADLLGRSDYRYFSGHSISDLPEGPHVGQSVPFCLFFIGSGLRRKVTGLQVRRQDFAQCRRAQRLRDRFD
jgi:hypothetical protein